MGSRKDNSSCVRVIDELLLQGLFYPISASVRSFMEESDMKISRRTCFLVLAGALGGVFIDGKFSLGKLSQVYAATGAPIGQTIWLQTTNNNNYVSTRIDQTNSPLEAIAAQVQAWEEFDVVDAGNGLIALRAPAT